MFIDSRAQIAKFRRGTLKPNVHECLAALGRKATAAEDEPATAARDFARLTGCPLYCTVGERGILVADGLQPPVLAPGYPVSGPVDVVGAGDSATAGIVSALLAGATGGRRRPWGIWWRRSPCNNWAQPAQPAPRRCGTAGTKSMPESCFRDRDQPPSVARHFRNSVARNMLQAHRPDRLGNIRLRGNGLVRLPRSLTTCPQSSTIVGKGRPSGHWPRDAAAIRSASVTSSV